MTTNLATILATKIRTALEVDHSHDNAHTLATIGVLVNQAGLSLTPLPEQEQPRVAAEVQRHPSGVEVTQTGWKVTVDGKFAGMVDCLTGGFKAYTPGRHGVPHGSLDAAVSYIVAQHRTPSPERSIERVRDDAEEDSRREAEAVSA